MLNQHKRLLSQSLLVAVTAGALFANACSDSSDGNVNTAGGAGGKAGSGNAGRAGAGGKAGSGGSSGLEIAGAGPDNAGAGGEVGLAGAPGDAGAGGEAGVGGAPVAAIETYTAALSGVQEVPPVTTTATGAATFSYNPNTGVLSWNLTHNVVGANAAHIHDAAAGEANPTPLIPLAATSPTSGTSPLTAAQAAELRMGHLYVNVHSATNPNGEIRGQILVTGSQLWVASLKGTEEVPPNASAKVGVSSLIVNAAHTAAHYRVTSDIAAPTLSHIHTGITGIAGPVKFPFTLVGPTAEGDITTFDPVADYASLTNGQFYVNLHSADFGAGEIRGQLVQPGERIFSATLTGANEVPASGALGTGQVQFIVNAAGDTVRYQSVVTGLADATSAAIVTVAGLQLYPLALVGLNPTGTHAVTAADITAFGANPAVYYANINSTLHPTGEIRGPIVPH